MRFVIAEIITENYGHSLHNSTLGGYFEDHSPKHIGPHHLCSASEGIACLVKTSTGLNKALKYKFNQLFHD